MKHALELHVVYGDLCEQLVDAVVNPANRMGLMGGGVAEAIKMRGGFSIEEHAKAEAPIEIGEAIVTEAGDLNASYVIHAPTMNEPAEDSRVDWVRKAVHAALLAADERMMKRIAFPGMGTGIGSLQYDVAAEAMVDVARSFEAAVLTDVYFVAISKGLEEAFLKYVKA